jgi:8-oxo-dGTP pyrophosphatase MutT (NUDIX family)
MDDTPAVQRPAVPKLAATMLLVRDDPFEVLMVTRPSTGTFPSAIVFPGGSVDAADYADEWLSLVTGAGSLTLEQRALRIAAVRETREETGVDLNVTGTLHLVDIHPFAHLITPVATPRRFDTHFFVAVAPADTRVTFDGSEVISVEWMPPSALIARAEAGDPAILFPTYLNLLRLAESSSAAEAVTAAGRHHVEPITPTVVEKSDGRRYVTVPPSAGYPTLEWAIR